MYVECIVPSLLLCILMMKAQHSISLVSVNGKRLLIIKPFFLDFSSVYIVARQNGSVGES